MDATQTRKAHKATNEALHRLGLTYHDGIPLTDIDTILEHNGFEPLVCGIYTGHDGKASEQIGAATWLHLTWHRMSSGRYEVVAYVN